MNELLGFQLGFRESAQSWKKRLVDLKSKGLIIAPELATGDGALAFWKALDQVFSSQRERAFAAISGAPCTRRQTCSTLDQRSCRAEVDPEPDQA